MEVVIAGYKPSDRIYESPNSLVYRTKDEPDRPPAILKILRQDYPSEGERERYLNEYRILKNIESDHVIRTFGLEPFRNTMALIVEDFGGESLAKWISKSTLTIEDKLLLSIQIAKSLSQIHSAGIIHKDVNPSNIIWNPDTRELKLIDFGISSFQSDSRDSGSDKKAFEGTLEYLSPEQTGRINRSIDYRTDFYSFGVTLYQIFTGQLPFQGRDIMAIVHQHIAKSPIHPHEIDSKIPPVISRIIMKLLSKIAEQRYGSAQGIQIDLQYCLDQFRAKGSIEDFPIGDVDHTSRLHIPNTIYGREKERQIVIDEFETISSGAMRIITLSGYSGVGKTSLVDEVIKTIVARGGCVVSGKFDQYQREIPYFAISAAFSEKIRQILTEPESQLDDCKARLRNAIGTNGSVIIEAIPDVENLVGSQPKCQELGPLESRNRFNLLFSKFLKVFCNKESPLVLFLDDLQWIDSATLSLLESLINDSTINHLLIIGAYRDNEIRYGHPLLSVLDLSDAKGLLRPIKVVPLGVDQVVQLVSDTLGHSNDYVLSLAELVHQKTAGNPFFIKTFMTNLYDETYLRLESKTNGERLWTWNIDKIKNCEVTDNVVSLLTSKLRRLPKETQVDLQIAACIGNQFDINILSIISKKSTDDILRSLESALSEEIVTWIEEQPVDGELPGFNRIRFSHDSIQQAAYSLFGEEQNLHSHHQIGNLLLKSISKKELNDYLFEIVNHLNTARKLISDKEDLKRLARLNFDAGRKAKNAAAFTNAAGYFAAALEGLEANDWDDRYEVILESHKSLALCEYVQGNFERSEALFEIAFTNAKTNIEKAEICAAQISQYVGRLMFDQAVEKGIQGLRLCNIKFQPLGDKEALEERIRLEQQEVNLLLDEVGDVEEMLELDELTDSAKSVAIQIIPNLAVGWYIAGDLRRFVYCILRGMSLSLRFGKTDYFAFILSYYCTIIVMNKEYGKLLSFSETALKLSEQYRFCRDKAMIFNVIGTLCTCCYTLERSVQLLEEGYRIGLDTGDLFQAAACRINRFIIGFAQGLPLKDSSEMMEKDIALCKKYNLFSGVDIGEAYQMLISFLQGSPSHSNIDEGSFGSEQWKRIITSNSISFIHHLEMQRAFWHEDYETALKASFQAEACHDQIPGYIIVTEHFFIQGLILAHICGDKDDETKKEYIIKIERNRKTIDEYSQICPENFAHKTLLLRAELGRLRDEDMESVLGYYDAAISSAKENRFLQYEALANEMAAAYLNSKGKHKISRLYLADARYLYNRWGAKTKVDIIEKRHPHLLNLLNGSIFPQDYRISLGYATPSTPVTAAFSELDLETVLKASRLISSEIHLERLLQRMMTIVIQNTGAQIGLLIIEDNGDYAIKASAGIESENVSIFPSIPLGKGNLLPEGVVRYVFRTGESLVLKDASKDTTFGNDDYIKINHPQSLLCMPLRHKERYAGVLYLEHRTASGVFTSERVKLLEVLLPQAAISIDNAVLFEERKRVENALRSSEERLKLAMDATDEGVFDWDIVTGEVYCSPQCYSMLDYDSNEFSIFDSKWYSLIHPDERDHVTHELEKHRSGANNSHQIEYRFRAKSGEWRWILSRGRTVKSTPDGMAERIVGTQMDVSVQKDAETEKRFLEARLRQAQKMEAIGTLAGGIAHDFNNALAPIMGYADMILEELGQDTINGARANQILVAASHARDLVRQILAYSRKDKEVKNPIQILPILKEVIKLTKPSGQTNTELIQNFQTDIGPVIANPTHLQQVFMNLITNAYQAMANQGGKLSISVKRLDYKPGGMLDHRTKQGSYICLSVSDTGCGMTRQIKEKIFDPYFTTKEKEKGTGLGLSVVHGIVKNYGGEINVYSEPNQGTTFQVFFPEAPCQGHQSEKNRKPKELPRGEERILVVDDESEVAVTIKLMLTHLGYHVVAHTRASDALEAFRVSPDDYNLIISDMVMPQMSGIELYEQLKKIKDSIPFVLCSGFNKILDEDTALSMGISKYFMKPILLEELAHTVREVLDKPKP